MRPLLATLIFLAIIVSDVLIMTLLERTVNAQLTPLPGFPLETGSRVFGSMQCTKSSDESYAVCGSYCSAAYCDTTSPVKYNLQPFSFDVTGMFVSAGNNLLSCDLYENSSQSASRVVCAQHSSTILFLQVSDMTQIAQIPVAAAYYVVVDAPNEVAYVSDGDFWATIYKIINIASSSPSLVGNVTWGQNSGDQDPCALLIVGDFLYVHLNMWPARLARFTLSNFSHHQTVPFNAGETYGQYDNLANDNNFIYDLTRNGMLVRCTYQNNHTFSRFDSLSTGFTATFSLSISPDLQTLLFSAFNQNAVILVDVTAFITTLSSGPIIPSAFGRPIVMPNGIFYAFSQNNDNVYGFRNCYRPTNATYGGSSKILCPAGHFCPDPDATSPTPCGPGKFTPSEGWCSCLLCQEGFFCPSNTTVNPEPCPAGFFCPNTTSSITCPCGSFCPSRSAQPFLCDAGSFNPSVGSSSNDSCTVCPASDYCGKNSCSSTTCPCGSFCPSESAAPTACDAGFFNPDNGSSSKASCEVCPAGKYCPKASCSPFGCSCGMYCSEAGRTNCTPGYYNADPSYFCSVCPEGFYCPLQRTCSPIRCDENQFCPPGSSAPSLTLLVRLPDSPIQTHSGVFGSLQCTKSSDESYAVCGSISGDVIKYNLQPFSFAAKSSESNSAVSCDLYETSSQATSRVVCTRQNQAIIGPAEILFLQVSDMNQAASVSLPYAGYVLVDTPNALAYVSNGVIPPTIYKVTNIASSSPSVAGNVTWGQNSEDNSPCALLIVGDFLYAHLAMSLTKNPAHLERFRISTFTHDGTVLFIGDESGGYWHNLANDNNFIYDLTQNGIIVRCTYQNNNFARFDSLSTGFTSTFSLSISPDAKTLFFSAQDQNAVVLVDVASFSATAATSAIIPSAIGRPIVMSNGIFYAFSQNNDQVYGFEYCPSSATYGGSLNLPCPAGHFCPGPNATAPTPCSTGTYSSSPGFCVCPSCPSGAFCPSSSTITPQNCPVGTYNERNGASSLADCLPCPLGKICQEGSIAPIDCNQINCDSTRNCSLYSKVLVGVSDAQPYCVVSDHSTCSSPLTCSSINLPAYNAHLQCEAAGCSYSGGSCVNRNDCFNLFLPSFVIQPFGLMFIGFAKDVTVLLLIGIFGDVLMRKVKAMMLPFNFWRKKWNRDKIKVSMETTIFANDAKCRNETSTKQESFEEYCERIAIALFELPETDDDEVRKDWKRKLVDAITFSMFDSGLWFELEELEENNNKEQDITRQVEEVNESERTETKEAQADTSEKAFSPKEEEEGEPIVESRNDEDKKSDSNEVINDQNQPEEKNEHQLEVTNQNEQKPENVNCDGEIPPEKVISIQESQQNKKLILSPESFASTSTLQQLVNAHVTSHAQCVVYFASSRDWKLRAAFALNNFPSPFQLFYYTASVIIFVAFTFRDVVLDSTNQNIIDQVSNYTCGHAEKHSQSKTTYLLLGFRFLNSSSTATVILIFIKSLHAISSSSPEKFENLQLPQRLPILGLLTSKSTQILLTFYFLVVASFALAGVTYGIHILPSLVVVIVAAFLLLLDAAALKLVRGLISKIDTSQSAAHESALETVATQELPQLGLNSEDNIGMKKPLLSQSRRSLYTEDDDNEQEQEQVLALITADETFEVAKHAVLNPESTVSLPQALLVFLLKEEIPTIILTITLQLCFNYMCLSEFAEAFGVADQWQLPNTEYEARKFGCIWAMFESDVSSKMSVLASFVGFL